MAEQINRDEAIAQATELSDEVLNRIAEGEYDKAISLAGLALDTVTKACGDLSFEACKFYYCLADAILYKIETSTEILGDAGTQNALTMGDIEKSMDKLPEVLLQSASKVKEMFEQMAQQNTVKTSEAGVNEAKDTAETQPEEVKQPESSTEAPQPVENANVEAESNCKISSEVQQSEESPTKAEVTDKDNPKIEDDEEEEIITTTRNRKDSSEPEEEEKKGEENDEEEYDQDQFKAPWENLEVALTIFNRTMSMHENPEEFEQLNWNLKADILERQADLEIAREEIKTGIELYKNLIEFCIKHGCDPEKSRSIAGIHFKIGWAYNLLETGFQSALDHFYSASKVLTYLLCADINLTSETPVTVESLSSKSGLESTEVCSDKSKELKSLLIEIHNKIEECRIAISEQPLLENARKKEENTNGFKKPVFEQQQVTDLGSFGKGRKRQREGTEGQEEGKAQQEGTQNDEDHKRQKVEEQ